MEQETPTAAAKRDCSGGAAIIKSFSERNYLCYKHRHCQKQQQSCAPTACPAQNRVWCWRCSRSVPGLLCKRLLLICYLPALSGLGVGGLCLFSRQSGSFTSYFYRKGILESSYPDFPPLFLPPFFFSLCRENYWPQSILASLQNSLADDLTMNLFYEL